MKTIQAYVTEDGQMFASEDKAKVHEMFLKKQDVIKDFLISDLNAYKANAQLAIARSTVIKWELWKAQNVK